MKISKKKLFVSKEGDLFISQRIEYKPAQAVYEYELPIKGRVQTILFGGSPKSLGMKCIGAL
jgi:hypothetical protein